MFSVLQMRNPHEEADAWFGNHAIDPSAGKRAVGPPVDKKGRTNLFPVRLPCVTNRTSVFQSVYMIFACDARHVCSHEYGTVAYQAQGNIPCPPDITKKYVQVLSHGDPAPPSSDSWLGNQLIDPGKGKQWCAGPEIKLGRPNLFPLMQQVCTT